jgi:hypothetical protein
MAKGDVSWEYKALIQTLTGVVLEMLATLSVANARPNLVIFGRSAFC